MPVLNCRDNHFDRKSPVLYQSDGPELLAHACEAKKAEKKCLAGFELTTSWLRGVFFTAVLQPLPFYKTRWEFHYKCPLTRYTFFSIWKRKKTARTFSHNLVQAAAAAATGAGAPPLSKLLLFRLRMVFYDGDQSRALHAMITLMLKSCLKLLTNSDWFLYRVLLFGLEFATIISLEVGRGYHSTELVCALFCQSL